MNPSINGSRSFRFLTVLLLSAAVSSTAGAADYTVHEWGTFTSVQGADGALLAWRPLRSSELPTFVHDWSNAGYQRFGPKSSTTGKFAIISLQRMETPVIYFYADQEQTVDVSVQFPLGFITEWYPQADQIGPAGSPLDTSATNGRPSHTIGESGIHWANVALSPVRENDNTAAGLPPDQSGGHYFAARATDASLIRVSSDTNGGFEREKFLFYRGVGDFPTPLRVTADAGGVITLANSGRDPLTHLYLIKLHDGRGSFSYVEQIPAGEHQSLPVEPLTSELPVGELAQSIGEHVAGSLVIAGLFPREAAAMVNTWKDSWFAEDGWRVLYVLPEAWTDATLPITLSPKPGHLVRVMIGRAEVLPPEKIRRLHDELNQAGAGNEAAQAQAAAAVKKFGRFADPAVQLAAKGLDPAASGFASNLVQNLVVKTVIRGAAN
jgi:hypothetical protein